MDEYSRIIIEEYCMNHPKTKKADFLWEMVHMSYDITCEPEPWQLMHLSQLISRERNPELREALEELDEFIYERILNRVVLIDDCCERKSVDLVVKFLEVNNRIKNCRYCFFLDLVLICICTHTHINNGGVEMGENGMTFGRFVREHREALGKSLRSVAAEIEMAPAYLSDIEKGNRWPPSKYLKKLAEVLQIPESEMNVYYDLVGEVRDGEYPDLTDYIGKSDLARVALRAARDHDIPDAKWQAFIDDINLHSKKGD